MLEELAESFDNITYIKDESVWGKHIYDVVEISLPGDMLDCSTECKVLQAPQGCQFFFFSVTRLYQFNLMPRGLYISCFRLENVT